MCFRRRWGAHEWRPTRSDHSRGRHRATDHRARLQDSSPVDVPSYRARGRAFIGFGRSARGDSVIALAPMEHGYRKVLFPAETRTLIRSDRRPSVVATGNGTRRGTTAWNDSRKEDARGGGRRLRSLLANVASPLAGDEGRRMAPPTRGGATLGQLKTTSSTGC